MGAPVADIVIKTAIETALQDLRANPWLLDDVFGNLLCDTDSSDIYGKKEIDRAKEWFLNTKIPVVMRFRVDKDVLPCVTITLGSSTEKADMMTMADLSTVTDTLLAQDIGKPIPYMIQPFTPVAYNKTTGAITVPEDIDLSIVQPGQILANPTNGNGYTVVDTGPNTIFIGAGITMTAQTLGLVPQFAFYKARREHTFFQENYVLGCHVASDPAPLLWLHSLVSYCLLRYKEALLEKRNFTQSTFSSSDMTPNHSFDGVDKAYSRYITLTGMTEMSWLKAPSRIVEAVRIYDPTALNLGGLKIISNLTSPDDLLEDPNQSWTTIESHIDEDDV